MSQFMHIVRFIVGMAMLAGGVALARPFAAAVLAARGDATTWSEPPAAGPGTQPRPVTMMIATGHAIPDPRPSEGPLASAMPLPGGGPVPPAQPPQAPTPLPASGLDLTPAAPALDGTYRSTVEIPPPPLLDFHAPPPLSAGWAVHDVAKSTPPVPAVQTAAVPTDYVVRDGDDLTAIALRVYGHAGAATAIWAANRDRVTDPQVLPIGLALRLPPTWTLPAAHMGQGGASGQAIEPAFTPAWGSPRANGGTARVPAVAAASVANSVAEPFWLQEADVPSTSPAATLTSGPGRRSVSEASSAAAGVTHRPATVRVGMGDSLESIADRFYGDRTMASRIWQANRDRLRSPDLLVPGAELRLP